MSEAMSSSAWWMQYPLASRKFQPEPSELPTLEFHPQDVVRLSGKPDRERAVLEVCWHHHRHQWCYIVETTTQLSGNHCPAYWFAQQLISADSNTDDISKST